MLTLLKDSTLKGGCYKRVKQVEFSTTLPNFTVLCVIKLEVVNDGDFSLVVRY